VNGKSVTALSVVLLVLLIGYGATVYAERGAGRRAALLARTDRQLAELYGPLHSLTVAMGTTWQAFMAEYGELFGKEGTIELNSAKAQAVWRHWMRTVFMPLCSKMSGLVVDHADLIEGEDVPDALLKLVAHVEGYRAILAAWEAGDYSRHMALTPLPAEGLLAYARETFRTLKARQAELLIR